METMAKAKAYDNAVAEQQTRSTQEASRTGYAKGLEDMGLAMSQQLQQAAQYTPNMDQIPGQAPQGVNVTDAEIAAIQAAGLPMNMDSVMAVRAPVRNADQGLAASTQGGM